MRKLKVAKSPLERSIESREKGIRRMKENISRIRRNADDEIALVEARIKEKQILLDALKAGQLKLAKAN